MSGSGSGLKKPSGSGSGFSLSGNRVSGLKNVGSRNACQKHIKIGYSSRVFNSNHVV